MRISAKGEYAIKAVLDLALRSGDGLVPIQDIAVRQAIPQRYLEHVLLALKRRSEEHTSELQSHSDLVCRLLLEKKKKTIDISDELKPTLAFAVDAQQTQTRINRSVAR